MRAFIATLAADTLLVGPRTRYASVALLAGVAFATAGCQATLPNCAPGRPSPAPSLARSTAPNLTSPDSARVIIHVRSFTQPGQPIWGAAVSLRDSTGRPISVGTDSTGRASAELLPGNYELLVRMFGYTPARGRIAARSSFTDTVAVRLRAAPQCIRSDIF